MDGHPSHDDPDLGGPLQADGKQSHWLHTATGLREAVGGGLPPAVVSVGNPASAAAPNAAACVGQAAQPYSHNYFGAAAVGSATPCTPSSNLMQGLPSAAAFSTSP